MEHFGDPDHALLFGEICGTLSAMLQSHGAAPTRIELERDEDGDWTNHIRLIRGSGTYWLTLEQAPGDG